MKKHLSLTVSGMHCSSCETIIREELGELAGVSDITSIIKPEKGRL